MAECRTLSPFADSGMAHVSPRLAGWVATITAYNRHGCSLPVTVAPNGRLSPPVAPRARTMAAPGRATFKKPL